MSSRECTIFLLNGFDLHSFSALTEAMRLSNEVIGNRAYCWRLAGSSASVVSSCGVSLAAQAGGDWLPGPGTVTAEHRRLLIVCGGGNIPERDRSLEALIRRSYRNRSRVIGIAGGVFALASSGLLGDRSCSVHWKQLPNFSERFPDALALQTSFEISNDLATCAGGSAPFDLFLQIVTEDFGPEITSRVCEIALTEKLRESGARQRLPLQTRLGITSRPLIEMIERMQRNLTEPLDIAEILASGGVSRRQMERLFREEMGRSPAQYYRDIRLERAHLLLVDTALSVIEVAVASGFVSASHFSRIYRQRYGSSPQEMRIRQRQWQQHATSQAGEDVPTQERRVA